MNSGRKDDPPPNRVKAMLGPILQTATAGTLVAESMLHRMGNTAKPFAQIGIGHVQRSIGFGGALYYGHKAIQGGDASDATKAVAYTGFAAHGYARMLEAPRPHPQWTPGFGLGAAILKGAASGPSAAPGFIADAVANAAELMHAKHPGPGASPLSQAVSHAAHNIKPMTIMKTQRLGAAFMLADAIYQGYKKL